MIPRPQSRDLGVHSGWIADALRVEFVSLMETAQHCCEEYGVGKRSTRGRKGRRKGLTQPDSLDRCPDCGAPRLAKGARRCPACTKLYPSLHTKSCPKCKELVPESAVSCSHCRASFYPIKEAAWVAAVAGFGVLLLFATLEVLVRVFPPGSPIGALLFVSLAIGYTIDGTLLGIFVPWNRWFPKIVTAAGITSGNVFFYPFSGKLLPNVLNARTLLFWTIADALVVFLWTLALVHVGILFGNKVGARLGYQQLPKDPWIKYVTAFLLVLASGLIKLIIGKIGFGNIQ